MTWNFEHAGRLWWLLGLVVLLAAYIFSQLRRRRHFIRFSHVALIDKVAPKRPSFARHVVALVFLLGLGVGGLGLAQPVKDVKVPKQRATIMLAIDTSLSMKATDVAPTRIAAAKASAKKFVDKIPKALNIGLVSFDTGARVDVVPTTDRLSIKRAIDRLKLHEGTAIGDAVDKSLEAIADVPKGEDGKPIPAVIVLLSDGSTTVGKPTADAIPDAQKAKVSVWTIAFGTPDGSIDVTLPDTGETVRVQVPVDATALASLSESTGGQTYTAESAQEVTDVYQQLGSSIGYDTEKHDITIRYLAVALAALALAGLASTLVTQRLP